LHVAGLLFEKTKQLCASLVGFKMTTFARQRSSGWLLESRTMRPSKIVALLDLEAIFFKCWRSLSFPINGYLGGDSSLRAAR
jgi:hypothetical protein